MIRLLLAVLFLSTMALAQPLAGPFTIMDFGTQLSATNPQLTLRDAQTADVFFQVGDSVFHGAAQLASGQISSYPVSLPMRGNWQRRLTCVEAIDSGWAALVYDTTEIENRVSYLRGKDGETADTVLRQDQFPRNNPWGWGSASYGFTLQRRATGGCFAVWQDYWETYIGFPPYGWIEGGYGFIFRALIPDWSLQSPNEGGFAGCYWPGPALSRIFYVSDDSLLFLETCEDGTRAFSLISNGHFLDFHELGSAFWTGTGLEISVTRGGRCFVLAPTTAGSGVRLFELWNFTDCVERLSSDVSPIAAVSSRDFGLAWLSIVNHALVLTRVDTTGNLFWETGDIYRPDLAHEVVEAALTISDSGRIAALWTERVLPNTNASQIKIASLDWETPLGTDDPRFIPHPSSLILSAFPNPFNSELRISYELPRAESVELSVYNLLGQKVASLFSGKQMAGAHDVSWSPSCSGGIYFVSLKTASAERVQKVVYLR